MPFSSSSFSKVLVLVMIDSLVFGVFESIDCIIALLVDLNISEHEDLKKCSKNCFWFEIFYCKVD